MFGDAVGRRARGRKLDRRDQRVRAFVPVGFPVERFLDDVPAGGAEGDRSEVTTVEARRNGAVIPADRDPEAGGRAGVIESRQPIDGPELRTQSRPPIRASRRDEEARDDAERTLRLVVRSRTAAVWLTVFIATISFVLSFNSLRSLAAMTAWPGWPSWLSPLLLDGLIVLATLGIVSLAPYREQFRNRVFLWTVLGVAALVSVGGNGLHAWLSTGHLVSWMRWGSAGLACVPPVALLATTHILGILWRFDPVLPPDARSEVRDRALELAAQRMDRWEAAAAKLHEDGYCPSVPTEKMVQVLRYLYESRPALSLRAIGAKPEVGLHHDTVGKIRDAATAGLGMTAGGEQ
ncbi:DUF2637 domain-containing protein [Mycobacterium intracellulare]|uniref:DUF2637 domain-containing protein n=1 Tax=Mycobacterium intracellulare TaxID=1767 RepID=UPI001E444774|nr:DUF2637 domain-containing protein [Mycobacterium intracellulare]